MLTEVLLLSLVTLGVFLMMMFRIQDQVNSGYTDDEVASDNVNHKYLILLKTLGIGLIAVLLKSLL